MTNNMTPSLQALCRTALATPPSQPAIHFQEHWFTWGDMQRVASQLTDLVTASGAGEHATVAFVARNRPSALAAFLGLLSNACTVRMVYPFQSSQAIATELATIQPDIVVAAKEDFTDTVFSVLREHHIAAIALTEMQAETFQDFSNCTKKLNEFTQPQVILLTSGTTGKPKPFALSHETVARFYTGNVTQSKTETAEKSAALLYFPVSNISGLYATLPPLINSHPIVLLDRFNLNEWLAFVRHYRPTLFGMPPAGFKMLLDENIPKQDLASIQAMGAGAAPLDPAIQKQFEERYNIPILLSYGATEFGGPVCSMSLSLWQQLGDAKRGSVGKPLPNMQLRVVDIESGQPLDPGNEGLLEVISCRIGPHWIRTSDLAVIDEDGFLFLRGRADGAIIRGGFKLPPASIEAGLLKNPHIAMACVVGIPDQRLGQVPAAAIVLKNTDSPISFDDLEADLRQHVPSTYIPTHWQLLDELPRTPSMKVDLPAVKALFS